MDEQLENKIINALSYAEAQIDSNYETYLEIQQGISEQQDEELNSCIR